MNCPDCGKEVKAIALNREESVLCETAQVEIVLESGRVFRGYARHECDGKKEERSGDS